VHVLDLADPDGLVSEIKHRYERPLKEIFGC
jgi:multicomponent K+:H+ antiporter subunit E